ncbi:MAG TPA: LytTR family DNA-binding domain-containing protein [Candidatus Acidoferrum sp.]|nr:LytTR family DNA-binding domain-containing protein [Candidatus Acidoferrum sp.]
MNITVCDDNKEELDCLCAMIEKTMREQGKNCQIAGFTGSDELTGYLRKKKSDDDDIAFIDIQLRDENGIQVARSLAGDFPNLSVIFVSGHISYAQDIFEAKPTYFLLKPVAKDKLEAALSMAVSENEQNRGESVKICSKGHVFHLRLKDIQYVSSDRRVAAIHGAGGELKIYAKLDELEQVLGGGFLRCHQSYLVNMERVASFDQQSIRLYTGEMIPVSKKRYAAAKAAFLRYLGDSL